MRYFGTAICAFFLLAGCKKIPFFSRSNEESNTNAPAPIVTQVRLPFEANPQHPTVLDDWIKYLTEARLAFLPGVRISCQEDRGTLTLRFTFETSPSFECRDLFALNTLDATRWKCLSTNQMQHTLENTSASTRCENLNQFFELIRPLKIRRDRSLYTEQEKGILSHNPHQAKLDPPQMLPQLLLNRELNPPAETALLLDFPNSAEWLENSSDSGVIALVLEIEDKSPDESSNEYAYYHLVRFVAQQKEPSKLRFFLNPTTLSPPKKKDSSRIPFYVVETEADDPPLFRDTCDYVNRWLKSRQILAGLDPKSNPPLGLKCRFRWGDRSIASRAALTLAKLPLPLVYDTPNGSTVFPFRNLPDALSANAFRSLKKP